MELLSYLSGGGWISGEEIASAHGISRAAVWKQVQALRSLGYQIESSTNRGYRLAGEQDILDPELVSNVLETEFLGRPLHFYKEVQSTNQVAGSIASSCSDGTAVLAEVQTSGKGRLSRQWHSPPGGIWISIVLKPKVPLAQAYLINMAVSVAIARCLINQYGLPAKIKWPNDIMVEGQKLCGILTEVSAEMDRLQYAVVGIGIDANINADDLPVEWNATSISAQLGHKISRTELIKGLLQEIEQAYLQLGSIEIYLEWKTLSATLGRRVRVTSLEGDYEGDAVSLSVDGSLEIWTESGVRRLVAGDCIHLRAL